MTLLETIIVLAVVSLSLLIAYPAIDATVASIQEYTEIIKKINEHNNRVDEVIKLGRPITLNNVTYYPNLTNQVYIHNTTKHKIIFGKYNTLRVERKRNEN